MSAETPQDPSQSQPHEPQGSADYPEAPRPGSESPAQPAHPGQQAQPAASDQQWHYASAGATRPEPGPERVGAGLLGALVAIVAGMVLTVVIWRLGFIASITSFVMAAGAVWLYARGAGRAPRKGLGPLIALIVVGVVASFFAVIASDAWQYYADNAPADATVSQLDFTLQNMFDGEVISSYGKDMAMFAVFAVLGIFGTLRRLTSTPA